MPTGRQALEAARDAAANLTRAVTDALQRGGEPSREITVDPAPVGPLGATKVRCPMYGGPCDPNPLRPDGRVTLLDLANSLRCAQELIHLMDLGLQGPHVPDVVIDRIVEITGPRP